MSFNSSFILASPPVHRHVANAPIFIGSVKTCVKLSFSNIKKSVSLKSASSRLHAVVMSIFISWFFILGKFRIKIMRFFRNAIPIEEILTNFREKQASAAHGGGIKFVSGLIANKHIS